ncbi:MAG TPA: histidine phosphatase family protein [Gemmataceae bacterium]|nr:histidine phosphatase family protein [Gemmataceae bacterium]
MHLYLIRHADAGDPLTWEGDDEDRPLTDLGHRQARELAVAMQRTGHHLRFVVSSPLVRARETAEELLGVWTPATRDPAICELLSPGRLRKRKLSRYLDGLEAPALAIVGHMPEISDYLGWLLGTKGEAVPLKKGGAACVELPVGPAKGRGELKWAISPDWYMPAET